MNYYSPLQLREIFHLEFLRRLGQKIKAQQYALKGGVNLRFFFHSRRYSEDMDLDVKMIGVKPLQDIVMAILGQPALGDVLKAFGAEKVVAPDISHAKQTETTQRFKIHLITLSGEDLFTKIEFSRRGLSGTPILEVVSSTVLRGYKVPPLLVSHYDGFCAINQKVEALAGRPVSQARDIFDIFLLSAQYQENAADKIKISPARLKQALDNLYSIGFTQFAQTVLAYLEPEEKNVYNSEKAFDEMKLRVADFIEELKKHGQAGHSDKD
jgi:Nucleotidyl transferase AbiEii toxin, Type IV TA system